MTAVATKPHDEPYGTAQHDADLWGTSSSELERTTSGGARRRLRG